MRNVLRGSILTAVLAAVVPVVVPRSVEACNRCCCRTCRQSCGRCCCRTPACPPVIQTQCAQQPVVQERDVVMTEYRTEPIVETVPATVVENVVVDEGSFQTVWVPRVTTKAVARTTYQSRTAYRTVPYQVTRRVSEYGSQTVQTVRGTTTGGALAYGTTSSIYGSTALAPAYGPTLAGSYPTLAGSYPTLAGSPTYPTPVTTAGSASPVPSARYADAPATPISPRSASNEYRYSDRRTADRGSLFVPAPSAAQVWQTQRDSLVR